MFAFHYVLLNQLFNSFILILIKKNLIRSRFTLQMLDPDPFKSGMCHYQARISIWVHISFETRAGIGFLAKQELELYPFDIRVTDSNRKKLSFAYDPY